MDGSSPSLSDDRDPRREALLARRQQLTAALCQSPYDLILYLDRAVVHSNLAYPDLAASDAYRALLLVDETSDESFEYHEQALKALEQHAASSFPDVLQHGALADGGVGMVDSNEMDGDLEPVKHLAFLASVRCYQILSLGLLLCGCLKSSLNFCERGLGVLPGNKELQDIKGYIVRVARQKLRKSENESLDLASLPDRGLVRREVYPWNTHEPNRFSEESLAFLNKRLSTMAPKCAVKVSHLPVLLEGATNTDGYNIIPTCSQLGLFATEDIEPGEAVLKEYTLLTANNRHKESTCDACGAGLPALKDNSSAVSCPECYDTVFCSEFCFEQAQQKYHPAVCDKEVDSVAKDPDAKESDDSLYVLLLARILAMASHQDIHPLEVEPIKYIWGDFVPSRVNDLDLSVNAGPPPDWTLPFSFKYSIETPLHLLEKMGIDIYANLDLYDTWVLNTAYAKFRGTASARKSTWDGRPDVAAVHPYWCLANHDCDPNVTWEWGGRMVLWARDTRVVGNRKGGIKAGEEILNHYCDVDLPVQERREWAKGSLGGWCMCQRCRKEAAGLENDKHADAKEVNGVSGVNGADGEMDGCH